MITLKIKHKYIYIYIHIIFYKNIKKLCKYLFVCNLFLFNLYFHIYIKIKVICKCFFSMLLLVQHFLFNFNNIYIINIT